jgi:hypothetical protein
MDFRLGSPLKEVIKKIEFKCLKIRRVSYGSENGAGSERVTAFLGKGSRVEIHELVSCMGWSKLQSSELHITCACNPVTTQSQCIQILSHA